MKIIPQKKLSWAIGALFFGQLLAICNAVSGIFNQIINEQSKVSSFFFLLSIFGVFFILSIDFQLSFKIFRLNDLVIKIRHSADGKSQKELLPFDISNYSGTRLLIVVVPFINNF